MNMNISAVALQALSDVQNFHPAGQFLVLAAVIVLTTVFTKGFINVGERVVEKIRANKKTNS